jgi:hypothetical protein
MDHPPVHLLMYGDSGSGKSTSTSTFPKPMLVLAFDPYGKETPYLKRGVVAEGEDDLGTRFQDVLSKKSGSLLIRIEHYIDVDPTAPEAYRRFLTRLTRLSRDVERYQTVVLDSVTFMELAARKMNQYVLNPNSKEPRQWFAGATDTLEEVLMLRFGALPCNVVVLAHIDEDKDEVNGTYVRNPSAPGRLRKRSPAGYSELYRAYARRNEGGVREYVWQTRSDALYNASSQVNAPDPCPQTYAAIWTPS